MYQGAMGICASTYIGSQVAPAENTAILCSPLCVQVVSVPSLCFLGATQEEEVVWGP